MELNTISCTCGDDSRRPSETANRRVLVSRVSPVARFIASLREAPGVRLPDGRRKAPVMWRAVGVVLSHPWTERVEGMAAAHFFGKLGSRSITRLHTRRTQRRDGCLKCWRRLRPFAVPKAACTVGTLHSKLRPCCVQHHRLILDIEEGEVATRAAARLRLRLHTRRFSKLAGNSRTGWLSCAV